jgi:hypothetical protein
MARREAYSIIDAVDAGGPFLRRSRRTRIHADRCRRPLSQPIVGRWIGRIGLQGFSQGNRVLLQRCFEFPDYPLVLIDASHKNIASSRYGSSINHVGTCSLMRRG